jgi:aspartate/methionine/tyrosine aminotransferase
MYPDPGFPIYRSMIEFTGATPVPIPIREGYGFAFSAEETLSLITPRTRLIILNSPANPTGGVVPKEEFDKLVAGLEAWPDIAILSDEIYDRLLYDGEKHITMLAYPQLRDRLIILNGWSKTYAMTGWRLGYAVWPGKLYDLARKLAVNFHSCVNAPTQYAGIAALTGPQDCVETMRKAFDERRIAMVKLLRAIPSVTCREPKGAFYAFPDLGAYIGKSTPDGLTIASDVELCDWLLDAGKVAVVPGSGFGAPGHVRLSYACSMPNIENGVARIAKTLATLR